MNLRFLNGKLQFKGHYMNGWQDVPQETSEHKLADILEERDSYEKADYFKLAETAKAEFIRLVDECKDWGNCSTRWIDKDELRRRVEGL